MILVCSSLATVGCSGGPRPHPLTLATVGSGSSCPECWPSLGLNLRHFLPQERPQVVDISPRSSNLNEVAWCHDCGAGPDHERPAPLSWAAARFSCIAAVGRPSVPGRSGMWLGQRAKGLRSGGSWCLPARCKHLRRGGESPGRVPWVSRPWDAMGALQAWWRVGRVRRSLRAIVSLPRTASSVWDAQVVALPQPRRPTPPLCSGSTPRHVSDL